MIHTKEQIIEISKKIISDLNGDKEYFKPDYVNGIVFNKNIDSSEPSEKTEDVWLIYLKVLFKNVDILTISDETGEPAFIRHFTYQVHEIKKNDEGKYYIAKKDK